MKLAKIVFKSMRNSERMLKFQIGGVPRKRAYFRDNMSQNYHFATLNKNSNIQII